MSEEKTRTIISTYSRDYPDGGNPVELVQYTDGSVAFTRDGAEHFVYLYPDQLKTALKILRKRRKSRVDAQALTSLIGANAECQGQRSRSR